MAKIRKLLFVDTNILLDFYRTKTEAGLSLLKHLDQIAPHIITTFQVEMEFKKNRQNVMKAVMSELKAPVPLQSPGLFSDAAATKAIKKSQKVIDARVKALRERYGRAFRDPAKQDPVYQVCQRIFHKDDGLVLTRAMPLRKTIRTKALRRFLMGCPPRKGGDTSIGDAINWEWMIHCAKQETAELVIVSRDSDYGTVIDPDAYINDHLKQEFAERVSRKREILLYYKLSSALKHFHVRVTEAEEQEEASIARRGLGRLLSANDFQSYVNALLDKSRGQIVAPPGVLSQADFGASLGDLLRVFSEPRPSGSDGQRAGGSGPEN